MAADLATLREPAWLRELADGDAGWKPDSELSWRGPSRYPGRVDTPAQPDLPPTPPNLAAIAVEAGVSRMTVSRVLRNYPYVKAETRDRVHQAVERLQYRPNPMVSAFMTYVRSGENGRAAGTLAYLTNSSRAGEWKRHNVYLRFFEGAQAWAQRRGYTLEEHWLRAPRMSSRRMSEILHARGICGLIVGPMPSSHGHLNLDWKKFCAVTIGYSLLRPNLPRASNNQYNSMLLALRELRRLGYRRIGMAMPADNDERVRYLWSGAYLAYHHRYFGGLRLPPYLPAAWRRDTLLEWIREHRPEVIITTVSKVHGWLLEEGFRLPEDIGLVHLDLQSALLPCAGIDQRPERVAGAAVDMCIELINHNEFGLRDEPRVTLLDGAWRPGPTVRPLVDGT